MKSFLKHILGLTAKKPLQPIIIMVMIVASVAVFLVSMSMMQSINRYKYLNSTRISGDAHIRISVAEDSNKRFITKKEVDAVLDDRGTACGFFSFGGYVDFNDSNNAVIGMAVDLRTINAINPINYSEKEYIPSYAYDEAAVISKSLSQQLNLQINDEIKVHIKNDIYQTYVVYAIAENTGIFIDYDIIVDDYSLTRVIFGMIISSKDAVFYNNMLIKLYDEKDYDTVLNDLKASSELSDKTIGQAGYYISDSGEENMMLIVMVGMSIFVIIVIFSAFVIFSYNQNHVVSIFKSLGASECQLRLFLYLECLIYSVIAASVGLLLAEPIVNYLSSFFAFGDRIIFVEGYQYAVAFGYGILISLISVTVPIIKLSKKSLSSILSKEALSFKRTNLKAVAAALSLSFGLFIALFFVKGGLLPYLSLLSFVAVIITLYLILPYVVIGAATILLNSFNSFSKKSSWLNISFKKMKSDSRSQNTYRLVAVVALIFLVSFRALNVIIEILNLSKDVFSSNFIVMGVNDPSDNIYGKVSESQSVNSVIKAYLDTNVELNGVDYIFVATDMERLDEIFNLAQLEIEYCNTKDQRPMIISESLAKMKGWKLGENVELRLNGESYEFQLFGVINTRMWIAIVGLSDIKESYNALFIKSGNKSQTVELVHDTSSLSGGVLIETNRFFDKQNANVDGTVVGIKTFMAVIAVMAFVGIVNNLIISIIQGKEQKRVFLLLGTSKPRYFLISLIELSLGIVISAALGIAFGYFSLHNLSKWLVDMAILI